jgi:hypothetical protein
MEMKFLGPEQLGVLPTLILSIIWPQNIQLVNLQGSKLHLKAGWF